MQGIAVRRGSAAGAMAMDHPEGMQLRCPKCGSDDTRTFPMAHSEGLTRIELSTTAIGVGVGAGGVGVGGGSATSSGSQQTHLSAAVAPPKARQADYGPSRWGCLSVGVLAMVAGGVMPSSSFNAAVGIWLTGFVVALGILVALSSNADKEAASWNNTEYPRLEAEWMDKAICLRCGAVWRRTVPKLADSPMKPFALSPVSWVCRCGWSNRGTDTCPRCGEGRTRPSTDRPTSAA